MIVLPRGKRAGKACDPMKTIPQAVLLSALIMVIATAEALAFTCDASYRFPFSKKIAGKSIEFGYSGQSGPGHWGSLAPDNKWGMCETGYRQAPIALSQHGAVAAGVSIEFHYNQDIHFVDHSDDLSADHGAGNYIVIDGIRYELLQMHFHQPSESILNGKTYPLELHLVHRSQAGVLAVVGVFIVKGRPDRGVIQLPQDPRQESEAVLIQPAALLPENRSFMRYNGSLTTPGCDQPVMFNMMDHPVQMSAEQIAAFSCGIANSARPLQKLNSRFVLYGK